MPTVETECKACQTERMKRSERERRALELRHLDKPARELDEGEAEKLFEDLAKGE